MRKTFEYESKSQPNPKDADLYARLCITIHISCKDSDGSDAWFDIEEVYNVDADAVVPFEALDPYEQTKVEQRAQELADEHGYEAFQEYAEGLADHMYEVWKDERDMRASEAKDGDK